MDQTEDIWVTDNEYDSWELLDKSHSDDEDFEIVQQLFNEEQASNSPKNNSLINLADTVLFQNEKSKDLITNESTTENKKVKDKAKDKDKDKNDNIKPRKRNNLKPRKTILKPAKNKPSECLEKLERQDNQETKKKYEKPSASKLKAQNEDRKKKLRARLGGLSLATILTAFGLSLIYLKPALDIKTARSNPVLINSITDITDTPENSSYSLDEEKLYNEYKPKPKIIKDHDRKFKQLVRGFDTKPIKKESKPTSNKSYGPKTYEEFMKQFAKENSCHKDERCQKPDAKKLIPNSTKSKVQSTSIAAVKTRDLGKSVRKLTELTKEHIDVRRTDSRNLMRCPNKSIYNVSSEMTNKCSVSNENTQYNPKNKIKSDVFYFNSKASKSSIPKSDDPAPCDMDSNHSLLIDELLKECTKNDRELKKLNRQRCSLPKPNNDANLDELLYFVKTYKKITKQMENFSHEQSRVMHKLEKAVFRQKFYSKVQLLAQKKMKEYDSKNREDQSKGITEAEYLNKTEFMKTEGEKVMMDILRVTIQNKVKNDTRSIEECAVRHVEQILSKDESQPEELENKNSHLNNNTDNSSTNISTSAPLISQQEEACLQTQVKVNRTECWKKAVKNVKDEEQKRFINLPAKCNPQKTWIKKIEY